MSAPRTLGEAVEHGGYAEVMLQIMALAEACGRMPCGEWDYAFTTDPRWRVCVNGGERAEWTPPEALAVPRYHAYLEFNGWPAGLVNPAEGWIVGDLEAEVIAALQKEIAQEVVIFVGETEETMQRELVDKGLLEGTRILEDTGTRQ